MAKIICFIALLLICACSQSNTPASSDNVQSVECDTSSAKIVGDKAYKGGKWYAISAYYEYDANGDTIHTKYFVGQYFGELESRYVNRIIRYRVSTHDTLWYDAKGNSIHQKWLNGDESWKEYDANDKLVHNKSNTPRYNLRYEEWYEYDVHGNIVSKTYPNGKKDVFVNEYDYKGNIIHMRGSDSDEYYTEYKYDSNGTIIHSTQWGRNYEDTHDYDSKEHLIHTKFVNSVNTPDEYTQETWITYDDYGNVIYTKKRSWHNWIDWLINFIFNDHHCYEYDSKGHLIHENDSEGSETWYEYDANGNLSHKKSSDGSEYWYAYDYKKIAGRCRVVRQYDNGK